MINSSEHGMFDASASGLIYLNMRDVNTYPTLSNYKIHKLIRHFTAMNDNNTTMPH